MAGGDFDSLWFWPKKKKQRRLGKKKEGLRSVGWPREERVESAGSSDGAAAETPLVWGRRENEMAGERAETGRCSPIFFFLQFQGRILLVLGRML